MTKSELAAILADVHPSTRFNIGMVRDGSGRKPWSVVLTADVPTWFNPLCGRSRKKILASVLSEQTARTLQDRVRDWVRQWRETWAQEGGV